MEARYIKISQLEMNRGQLVGVPTNPRTIKKADITKIAKSLRETPELFVARPCLVVPLGKKFVIVGGNLRYLGAKENGDTEVPCYVLPEDITADKIKEIVIKDNGQFGAWDFDMLANEWDNLPLTEWGVDLKIKTDTETEKLSDYDFIPLYYQPDRIPQLKLQDCVNLDLFNAKVKAIEDSGVSDEMKNVLRFFAYRFIKIDFEAVANYYAFCATDEEKEIIQRLRLVLVDDGSIGGFIEDELLRINKTIAQEYDEL